MEPGIQVIQKVAQEGDVGKLTELMSQYDEHVLLDLKAPKSGDTLVLIAARNGRTAVLKYLVEKYNVDLEQTNADGKRPLHESAQSGHKCCLRYLIAQGVQIDCLKRADWTPLMLACTKRSLAIIEELIDANANLSLKNKDGWNSFHIAAREGDVNILKHLLKCDKSLWDTVSKNGRTPLHTAALHGHLDVVQLLLEACAYHTDMKDSCGTTPFMDAIRAGYTDVADLLLRQHGASVHAQDVMGREAIHLAAQAGCGASVKYLVEQHGVNVDTPTTLSGVSPLHLASKEGQDEVLRLLLSYGADVGSVDHKGRTALHIASGGQHAACLRILLQHGATNSAADHAGNLASSLAVRLDVKEAFDSMD